MTKVLDHIIDHLEHSNKLAEQAQQQHLVSELRELQTWQTRRLIASHQDLMESKRFRPAMTFFVNELYGPKDFSQRDQEIARVVPKMSKLLPKQALSSLESALRLNRLSHEMDFAMTLLLKDKQIDRHTYAEAYRALDNPNQRAEQIELLEELGNDLADVIKLTGISTLLMLSRKPAKVAGVESLHSFLESGFKAFKKLGKVEEFIQPIVNTERQIMQELFDPNTVNPLPNVEPV